jgi:hypothetical protein
MEQDPWRFAVFAREEYANLLVAVLPSSPARITHRAEFAATIAKQRPCLAFVDVELLPQLDGSSTAGAAIVGVTHGGVNDLVTALLELPKLSHVVSTAMLTSHSAAANMIDLCSRIGQGREHNPIGDFGVGRAALLASSERRAMRLDRMAEFFAAQGTGQRTIAMMCDIAEELITNALYDAPHEARWFSEPVSRTSAVELPPEHACEISYGIDRDRMFVRVRDPFGSLTHARLLQVLARCRTKEVHCDESRGGAGLGMWRVFSSASSLVVSVSPGRLTDIIVWVDPTNRRPAGKLHTVQLSFPEPLLPEGGVAGRFAADHDFDLMDESFTALIS